MRRKAIIFDMQGNALASAYAEYPCTYPKPNWVEQDADLVVASTMSSTKEAIAKAGVSRRVSIHRQDIFTVDLGAADVVAVYLIPRQLEALLPQLKQLKPGSRVVSHHFVIPGVEPDKSIEIHSAEDGNTHSVHLWTTPLKVDTSDPES